MTEQAGDSGKSTVDQIDRRLAQLIASNPDLLLADSDPDGGVGWQIYVDACLSSQRRLNRRQFLLQRRIRACPGACALAVWRAALILALTALALAAAMPQSRASRAEFQQAAGQFALLHLRRLSVALGLHRLRCLQDFALAESPCLLPNPLHRWLRPNATEGAAAPAAAAAPAPCCLCSFTLRRSALRNASAARDNYRVVAGRDKPAPFLVTNAISSGRVSYRELRDMYMRNHLELESTGYNWVTSLPHEASRAEPQEVSGGLSELFSDPAGPPANFTIAWRSVHAEAARRFRRLLPRPAFVGREMEIGLVRETVFLGAAVDGDAGAAKLELFGEMQNVFAVMLEGEALVSLMPAPRCDCPPGGSSAPHAVHMRPGQLLFFRSSCHQVRVARWQGSGGHAILHFSSQQ